jgi:hypothetical protein
MKIEARTENNPDLLELQQQLTTWRSENTPPKRIPTEIWDEATRLAKHHGVGVIARALRLDHSCLKRRLDGKRAMSPTSLEPAFFELFQTASPLLQGCVVTLEGPNGGRARLELSHSSPVVLATFFRELGL